MWYNLKVTVKEGVEIMQIMIEIPDHLANQLQLQPSQISQKVLELIVADNYRQGLIGAGEVHKQNVKFFFSMGNISISQRSKGLLTLH
jgi:hypothetical protein